ncbi:MAG: hypothetical protein BWY31_02635 [Lentisphaerae bacterium ADurb.Bin242]|nr:MAG: hypothetical protein BWY31_02635 [Lentisphaerae bacterium ADurb.Bin242]
MEKRLHSEHSTIYQARKNDFLGYFGWPTVCRTEDGTLYVSASGFRNNHICPFGKSVLFSSRDDGITWSLPEVINDSKIDDRDAGVLALKGNKLLYSWFTSDTRYYKDKFFSGPLYQAIYDSWTDEDVQRELGTFVRMRETDGRWNRKVFTGVTAPHGPIQLKNGRLFYIGRRFGNFKNGRYRAESMRDLCCSPLRISVSNDEGKSWMSIGEILPPKGVKFCEPHAVELENGNILAMIRTQNDSIFELRQSISCDGGKTWSNPRKIANGAPPHLLRHSSGIIICSYGYRSPGYGQRVMFSKDEGENWDIDWIIRDDGTDWDLGYPSSVEKKDGSVLTVYYQASEKDNPITGILASAWFMPDLV